MKKVFTLLVSFMLMQLQAATAQINISITTPTLNKLTDDTLTVMANITSNYSLDTVKAIVNNRVVLMTPVLPNVLTAKVYLGGLPQDTLLLKVWAKDVLNNTDSATRNFIYDQKPRIFIDSPGYYIVARPLVRFKAQAIDSNTPNCPVSISVWNSPSASLGTYASPVDTVFDLSEWNGQIVFLVCTAQDNMNQTATKTAPKVAVEASPYLTDIYNGRYIIRDFQAKRMLLYAGEPASAPPEYLAPWVVDLNANDTTIVPFKGIIARGKLTNSGAVFGALDSIEIANAISNNQTTANRYLYAWDNISLQTIPQSGFLQYISSPFSYAYSDLRVSGNLVAWHDTHTDLHKYTFPNMTDTLISSNAGNNRYDITANGTVGFWGGLNSFYEYDVIKYQNGAFTKLTNDNGVNWQNVYVRTDGTNFVYLKRPVSGSGPTSIYRFDGVNHNPLASFTSVIPIPDRYYQVNNGFVAYIKDDIAQVPQVKLISPNNTTYDLSFFGNGTRTLNLLSPTGGILYQNAQPASLASLYYADSILKTGPLVSPLGNTYFYNGEWFYSLAGNLYKLNIDTTSLTIGNIQKTVVTNDSIRFQATDFKNVFSHPGHPVILKITAIPSHGVLKYKTQVLQNGDSLYGGKIGDLVYMPNSNYVGADTFYWNTFDGYRYAVNNAGVFINVTPINSIDNITAIDKALVVPNPSNEKATLKIYVTRNTQFIMKITDITGREQYHSTIYTNMGENLIPLPAHALSTGLYFIKIGNNTDSHTVKWLKY